MKHQTNYSLRLGIGLLIISSFSLWLLYYALPQVAQNQLPKGVYAVAAPNFDKQFELIKHGLLGFAHLIFGIGTLLGGFAQLLLPKGNKLHRYLGRFFAVSLIFTDISALNISYSGHFHAFHVLAIVSLIVLALGVLPVIFSRSVLAMEMHIYLMYWSNLAPLAAFSAEMLAKYPYTRYYHNLPEAAVHCVIFWLFVFYFGQLPLIDKWRKQFVFPRRATIPNTPVANLEMPAMQPKEAA